MKKVLVVDDAEEFQEALGREKGLKDKVLLISAFSIKEAVEKFTANPDIDIIFMDACVDEVSKIDTEPLVHEFRKTFHGPMIAISSLVAYRNMLIEAGCNDECSKDELLEKLFSML